MARGGEMTDSVTVPREILKVASPSEPQVQKPDEYDIQVLQELAATLEFRSPERYGALSRLLASLPKAPT